MNDHDHGHDADARLLNLLLQGDAPHDALAHWIQNDDHDGAVPAPAPADADCRASGVARVLQIAAGGGGGGGAGKYADKLVCRQMSYRQQLDKAY